MQAVKQSGNQEGRQANRQAGRQVGRLAVWVACRFVVKDVGFKRVFDKTHTQSDHSKASLKPTVLAG